MENTCITKNMTDAFKHALTNAEKRRIKSGVLFISKNGSII